MDTELAAALRALQIHVAGDHVHVHLHVGSASAREAGSPSRSVASEGPPSGAASGQDYRWYVVWSVSEDPAARGIWHGSFPRVWDQLQQRLRGGRFFGSGARLRRCSSRAEAERAWVLDGPKEYRGVGPAPEHYVA